MHELELSQEQIKKSISAAFDSVNLIKQLNELPSLSIDDKNTKTRNVQHLQLMLNKDWFNKNITPEQLTDIESVIK